MQIITLCRIVACVCSLILLKAKGAAEISVEDPAVKDPSEEESSIRNYQQLDALYLDYLQSAVSLLEEKLKFLKSMRKKYIVGENMLKLDPYIYVADGVQYFKLMKRFAYEWRIIFDIVTFDIFEDLRRDFQERFEKYSFISAEQFRTIVENYLKTQQQLQVPVKDFADGNYPGAKYRTKLSADECYTIASQFIYDPAKHTTALEWLREALSRFDPTTGTYVDLQTMVVDLAFTLSETGLTEEAIKLVKKYMTPSMNNDNYYVDMLTYLKTKLAGRHDSDMKDAILPNMTSLEASIYPRGRDWLLEGACSQFSSLPKNSEAKLKCRYSTNGSPLFVLSPLKEEELYLRPKISIYRQFLTNGEINNIIKASLGKTTAAYVRTQSEVKPLRLVRDCKSFSMENEPPEVGGLMRRTDAMTGLTGLGAEPLQVSYYTAAGYFAAHDDGFANDLQMPHGNRITTVLFYLNDVEFGGETVFHYLNVSAKPEKGSALVWNNLKRNGIVDSLSAHGACPVLLGHKYIATRWYHHKPQVFLRPCTLKNTD